MEYDNTNMPVNDTALLKMLIDSIVTRQNEQAQTIADLRGKLEAVEVRMDEATHMTSEEYSKQVVEGFMQQMPIIQAQAMKAVRRGGRR